tara:strand:+ start:51 stop:335 length:285 start_codon:yes stop_codon:yes gene_type:complete
MDETWITYGVYAAEVIGSALFALVLVVICLLCWEKLQDVRHPENAKLDPWDENKKDYSLKAIPISVMWIMFCFISVFLSDKYLSPYIIKSTLGH